MKLNDQVLIPPPYVLAPARTGKPTKNRLNDALIFLLDDRRKGTPDVAGISGEMETSIRSEAERYALAVALLDAAGTQTTLT